MKFRLTFAPTADQSFATLPRRIQLQFDRAFGLLQQQPRTRGAELDTHQLYGYQNVWTLRIPPYRGIYAIDGGEVVLVIFGHRDTVYSTLHRLVPPRRQAVTLTSVSRRKQVPSHLHSPTGATALQLHGEVDGASVHS